MEVAIFLLLVTIICFLLTLVIISKDHDGKMIVTENEEGKKIFGEPKPVPDGLLLKRNCSSCAKFDTCLIWRIYADANKTIKAQIPELNLEATDYATQCPAYLSKSDTIGGR